MVSGFANDGVAMNMQNLPTIQPLSSMAPNPVQPMRQINQNPVQNVQQMKPMQSTQAGKGKKRKQKAQGMPQAKLAMPTMPQVQTPEVTKPLTAEDRFKQRVREMMKSGSTELVIDEDYNGLNSESFVRNYSSINDPVCLKSITDDAEVANYIHHNIKTLVVNCENLYICFERIMISYQEASDRRGFVAKYLNEEQTSYDQLFLRLDAVWL